MGCGCQGSKVVTKADREATRAARREQRLSARAARAETSVSAPTRFWNGPKGGSAA